MAIRITAIKTQVCDLCDAEIEEYHKEGGGLIRVRPPCMEVQEVLSNEVWHVNETGSGCCPPHDICGTCAKLLIEAERRGIIEMDRTPIFRRHQFEWDRSRGLWKAVMGNAMRFPTRSEKRVHNRL